MRGNIYLIFGEENERYKIGITKNSVDKRLKNLQTGNSSILTVKGTYTTDYMYRMETLIHNHFRDKKILNEWFELSQTDVDNFSTTCKYYENMIYSLKDNPFFRKNLR